MRMSRLHLIVASLLLLAGCTSRGTLKRDAHYGDGKATGVELEEVPVMGFNVIVDHGDDSKRGELLAVDGCFVYVLTDAGSVGIPSKDVETVKVQLYPTTAAAGVVVLTALGTLSTISHGYYLVISLPVWLGAGIPNAFSLGRADDFKIDHASPLLFQFARFPQGLPPGWKVGELMAGAQPGCTTTVTVPAP